MFCLLIKFLIKINYSKLIFKILKSYENNIFSTILITFSSSLFSSKGFPKCFNSFIILSEPSINSSLNWINGSMPSLGEPILNWLLILYNIYLLKINFINTLVEL